MHVLVTAKHCRTYLHLEGIKQNCSVNIINKNHQHTTDCLIQDIPSAMSH